MDKTVSSRRRTLIRLFSLRSDQAENETIDAAIRDNARLAGTNLWVLIFAIIIASVGLNVNSTAVIIGAMLISPLMGPIIGIGYGASIHDYAFIRQCFRHLALFVGISLLASTLYFLLTPLKIAHSELFARTSPTLWDVLIAFFGGAAGMVGLTRKEKTTLIPGVAIATALMPPICTAGFGLATGQPRFFLGAFFLFLINAVFIALATLTIARILRLPEHSFPDEATRQRGRHIIGTAIALTLIPSVYLAYQLVQAEIFTANAKRFVSVTVDSRDDVTLLARQIDPQSRSIVLTALGMDATEALEKTLNERLSAHGLAGATLKIRHPSKEKIDLGKLKQEMHQDVLRSTAMTGEQNAARIAALEARLVASNTTLADLPRIEQEIHAQLPQLRKVTAAIQSGSDSSRIAVLVALDTPRPLPAAESKRLYRWLKTRLPDAEIQIVVGKPVS
jgi:uncharacterized hydrophobic protein (TIGR00271 family)